MDSGLTGHSEWLQMAETELWVGPWAQVSQAGFPPRQTLHAGTLFGCWAQGAQVGEWGSETGKGNRPGSGVQVCAVGSPPLEPLGECRTPLQSELGLGSTHHLLSVTGWGCLRAMDSLTRPANPRHQPAHLGTGRSPLGAFGHRCLQEELGCMRCSQCQGDEGRVLSALSRVCVCCIRVGVGVSGCGRGLALGGGSIRSQKTATWFHCMLGRELGLLGQDGSGGREVCRELGASVQWEMD